MRVRLLRGGVDLDVQTCAHCGRRVVFGIVYSVTIKGEKFRVCSFECEKALKERDDPHVED